MMYFTYLKSKYVLCMTNKDGTAPNDTNSGTEKVIYHI